MKLSEVVKKYRDEHGMSMDAFAKVCGLSKSYISMLENERNPKSGKPIIPTIITLKKIANGMNVDLDYLISETDDQQIDISSNSELSFEEAMLLKKFRMLNSNGKRNVLEYIGILAQSKTYSKSIQSSLA